MNRRTRQSGQALVAATFGLVALIGATGLAIDMGYLRYQKRLQQSAADSAALAGAAETNSGNWTTAAQRDSALNGFTDGVNNVTVTVNPNYKGNPNAVEVLVSAVQPIFFMKIFGVASPTLTARAVAVFSGTGPRNCIYALGTGSSVDNDETLSVPNCGLISNGNLFNGTDQITAASIGVVGSAATFRVTPTPVIGIVPAADPLAYLQPPAPGGCLAPNAGVVTNTAPPAPPATVTLDPGAGTFCNGISVSGNRDVILKKGTFVVTGGGIDFGGSGTVSGTDVTFYLSGTGGAVTLHASQTFDLTAPTTGSYAGILFHQDSANASDATINGAGGSKLQGAFYFPNALLTVNGAASGAAYMIFVAKSLEFGSDVSFPSNYSSLPGGSPIKDAVLVE
jgi:hypothetical protein